MCEFQGLHAHELQQHLTDDHADELAQLIRCRCCSFMFFSDDDLKEHFKACRLLVPAVVKRLYLFKPPFGRDSVGNFYHF